MDATFNELGKHPAASERLNNSCRQNSHASMLWVKLSETPTSCRQNSHAAILWLTSNWHVLSSRLCLVMHLRTCLTTYIWSRKGLDVTCARLPIDRVSFHAHTTHSVTEISLSLGLVSGIAFHDTYATRISPRAASGVNSRHIGFLATGAQCDILLNCAL